MKFAIVDKNIDLIVSTYESTKKEQKTNLFGGPWDDARLFEHIKIPHDLESEELYNLEVYSGMIPCGCRMVPVGEKLAFDVNDRPILSSTGEQVTVIKYEEEPILEYGRSIRRKA